MVEMVGQPHTEASSTAEFYPTVKKQCYITKMPLEFRVSFGTGPD